MKITIEINEVVMPGGVAVNVQLKGERTIVSPGVRQYAVAIAEAVQVAVRKLGEEREVSVLEDTLTIKHRSVGNG